LVVPLPQRPPQMGFSLHCTVCRTPSTLHPLSPLPVPPPCSRPRKPKILRILILNGALSPFFMFRSVVSPLLSNSKSRPWLSFSPFSSPPSYCPQSDSTSVLCFPPPLAHIVSSFEKLFRPLAYTSLDYTSTLEKISWLLIFPPYNVSPCKLVQDPSPLPDLCKFLERHPFPAGCLYVA